MTVTNLFNIVLVLGSAVILGLHFVAAIGTLLSARAERRIRKSVYHGSASPKVSVIIPARDEEKNLPNLFGALDSQECDDFEIVFINDRSRDSTAGLLEEYAARHGERVVIVTLQDNPNAKNPKQYALARGTEHASGEILLLTDADCGFSPNWIRSMSEPFRSEKIGLVFGPVTTGTDGGYLSKYQAFDHLFRYFYTAGAAGIGLPSGGFGNNMAVRREALLDAGGFDSLPYSPTEDAALISAIRDKTDWRVTGLTSSRTLVTTAPEPSWKELTDQELRWNTGGIFAPDFTTRLNYSLVMLYLTIGVITSPLSVLYPPLLLTAASAGFSMFLIAAIAGILGRGAVRNYFRYLIPNVLLSMVYYSYITVLTLFRKPVVWKGEVLERI